MDQIGFCELFSGISPAGDLSLALGLVAKLQHLRKKRGITCGWTPEFPCRPVVAEQFSGSGSATRVGWTLGAGFEYAFTDRMSAKLEYLYFDLGNSGYNVTPVVATGAKLPQVWNATGGATGNIVRLGVNFRFN
jgi:opacity protein-like surface antigen